MLSTLLLLAVAMNPMAEPADAKADDPERSAVVKQLTEVLEATKDADDAEAAEQMKPVARQAADKLGDAWQATGRLRELTDQADPAALRQAFQLERTRLNFVPAQEAATPPGWPVYTVVGEIEIKQYPAYRMALASGDQRNPRDNRLFFTLFNHIKANDISMTAPVEMSPPAADGKATMAFLYPTSDTGTPGRQGEVEVVDVEPQTVVSLGLLGRVEGDAEKHEQTLRTWLKAHPEWRATGPIRILGYNSPMVPAFMSYSEIQLPVESAGAD